MTTQFHRFDISSPTVTDYKASGQVRGWLNNQFSMSEENGVLRVASTDAPPWWGGQEGDDPGSFVTTFSEAGGVIAKLGQVGGLGKGERIYSTRFIGDRAYVVTFRQTDPLYVVDLSRPRAPRVRGELKLQGYSAYLHPVGDGKLLGIGQDADANGRVSGTQVSLFDVSNPDAPKRTDRVKVPDSWSSAQWDHHAFLYWPATGLAVLPVTVYPQIAPSAGAPSAPVLPIVTALGLRVSGDKLTKAGSVEHPRRQDWATPIDRALVANGALFTVSSSGVLSSTLDTLTKTAWDHFDTP